MKLSDLFKELIVGAAILPMLLGSVFAVNHENEFGAYENIGDNLCTINEDLSFDCENTDNVLVGQNSSNWQPSSTSFFWTSSGLAVYHFKNYNPVVEVQGYVDGFKACRDVNCSYYNSDPNYTIDEFLNFVESHTLSGWIWYSTSTNPGTAGIIFTFTDGTRLATLPINYNNFTPYDFGLHGRGLDADYSNIGLWDTPYERGDNLIPLPDVEVVNGIPCYTVGDLLNATTHAYNTGMCYSFSLMMSGNSLVNLPVKNILEVFPSYNDYRNTYDLYINSCTPPASNEFCIESFSGKVYELSLIRKVVDLDYVHLPNLYDLCSLYINYGTEQNICELTGSEITPSFFTSEGFAEYLRKQGITYVEPAFGSVFSVLTGYDTNITGIFHLKERFANISSMLSAYNGTNSILPGYIAFAFLAFCLFYLFKR